MLLKLSQFFYDSRHRVYSQEISTLHIPGVEHNIDVLDEINNKIGLYVFSHCDSSDGDVLGWNYVPTMGTVKDNPSLANTRLLIIND